MWIVEFVSQKALKEFDSLPPKLHIRAVEIIKLLKEYGNEVGEPHTKGLGNGFFEIKAKSSEGVARSIYCYAKGKKILILISVVKKSDKLEKSVFEIAKNRLKEYENAKS